MEGYLTKLGPTRLWQKRYCVLKDQMLCYYKQAKVSPSSSLKSQDPLPAGLLELGDCVAVGTAPEQRIHCFAVTMPSRVFFLAAESQRECETWIQMLQAAMGSGRQQVTLNRKSDPTRDGLSSLTIPTDLFSLSLQTSEGRNSLQAKETRPVEKE